MTHPVLQQDLFTYVRPNYRASDPITSRDAGRSAKSFTAQHHAEILSALRRAKRPLAAEQIADMIGTLDTVRVCKRFAELERDGAIERTAEQHTNRSGRKAFRYRIKTTTTGSLQPC